MAETNKPQEAKQSVSEALKDNARTPEGAVRQDADAVRQVGRATGDALRQGSEMVADTERRGVEAGADAARRFAEAANDTARRSAQAVAEAQRQIVQDAAQRVEEVSRKVAEAAQGTTENIRCLMALPNAAGGGLRDLQQGMAGLIEGVTRTNLRAAQELFRLANPAPIVELQQRFVRDYTDTLLQNSATLARAFRRTAEETLRPIEEQLAQQRLAKAAE
ncbi:MAG TPA: phasin family protein [Acetobacteraceae bacterium]|nr:phasin family protein [Acetobacteraceae bacterium]